MRLLLATWLATTFISQAQQSSKPAPTPATLQRDLRRIAAYQYYYAPDFDIVGLTDRTARRLVAYLKTHDVSRAAARRLGLGSVAAPADATRLRVYGITFDSGGTRGQITIPILQWRNAAGRRFAYRLPAEDGFWDVYRLAAPGRRLYLLLGEFMGASPMLCDHAYVLELKGDYLLSNIPAFGKKPSFCLCNARLNFDPARQLLHLDLADMTATTAPDYNDENLAKLGYHRPRAKRLTLKFSGGRFVKSE